MNPLPSKAAETALRRRQRCTTARQVGALMGSLTFAIGVSGCFSPAQPDVSFTCDPTAGQQADLCPSGYRCEADGCCHKLGSDVEGKFGDCLLGLDGGSETDAGTATDTGTDDSTTTDGSTTDGDTGGSSTT